MQTNRKVVLLGGNPKSSLDINPQALPAIPASLTWTRSAIGTVVDVVEGKLNTCKINEARFTGRRVENLCVASNDLTNALWASPYAACGKTATTLTFSGLINSGVALTLLSRNAKGIFVATFDAWVDTGTKAVRFTFVDISDGSDAVSVTLTLTTTRLRYSFKADYSASATFGGNLGFVVNYAYTAVAGAINFTDILIEEVTGQANQNPSEYVSSGVLAYPYHGCGVGGVRYFNTTNGNTVSSNVVTEAPGTPLTGVTLLCEEARTNLLVTPATPATQNITTTAQSYTISMWGTGTCTLTGTATGTLTGTSATTRVSLTVTATAGTLTLTFAGTNTNGQFEAGASMSSYIPNNVARGADVASFTGAGLSWYNATQGTFAITAAGTAFKAPSDLGALSLTYASQTKYLLGYNNTVKNGSTTLYTAATLSNPNEYTGVAVPTTIYVNAAGIANISRFTYYPKALKPNKMAALL